MFDLSKPVQTSEGYKARIIATDLRGDKPIVAVISTSSGKDEVFRFYRDGKVQQGYITTYDLVNVPVRRSGWMNVYGYPSAEMMNGVIHPTREKADKEALEGRLACIKVSFEEGQGL